MAKTSKRSQIQPHEKNITRTKYLPEEIITQILYCVPAKSIGRFRSVSKGWRFLLTHPEFIKTYQNTIDKHHLIYSNIDRTELYSNLYDDHHEPILRSSDFHLDDGSISSYKQVSRHLFVCGSCNGLVLVVGADELDYCDILLVLLNPTTNELMQLPKHFVYSYLEAYETVILEITYGLGYDTETDDFKVVTLSWLHDTIPATHGSTFVDIYSLKTNTWRQLIDSLDYYCYISPKVQSVVFVNGFLHWIAIKTVNGSRLEFILAFNLADEKFSEVSSPGFVETNEFLSSGYCHLVVLGGKLALFHRTKGEIWLMNEYGIKESWTKILLHIIHGTPMVIPEPFYDVFYHDGKFMVANSNRMMMYDEKGTFVKTVCAWDPNKFKINGIYVESLVSIDSCIEK